MTNHGFGQAKYKTVAALGREPTFIEKYTVQLDVPLQSSIKERI